MKEKRKIGGRTHKTKSTCPKHMRQILKLKEENKDLKEVVGIMSDQTLMKKISSGIEDIQKGRVINEKQFRKKYC